MSENFKKSTIVVPPDLTALGAQLSEVLDKFNDLAADKLVANNISSGALNDQEPIDNHSPIQNNQPFHTFNI
mgnify:FL=1